MRKINAEERIRQLIDDVKPTAETLDIWSLATADGYMDCHKKAEKLAKAGQYILDRFKRGSTEPDSRYDLADALDKV